MLAWNKNQRTFLRFSTNCTIWERIIQDKIRKSRKIDELHEKKTFKVTIQEAPPVSLVIEQSRWIFFEIPPLRQQKTTYHDHAEISHHAIMPFYCLKNLKSRYHAWKKGSSRHPANHWWSPIQVWLANFKMTVFLRYFWHFANFILNVPKKYILIKKRVYLCISKVGSV